MSLTEKNKPQEISVRKKSGKMGAITREENYYSKKPQNKKNLQIKSPKGFRPIIRNKKSLKILGHKTHT